MPKHAWLVDGKIPAGNLPENAGGPGGAINSVFGRTGEVTADVHDYEGVYAEDGHDHDEAYSALSHTHDYAASDHNHAGVYSAFAHNHDAAYATTSHNHDAAYSAIGHVHAGSYHHVATLAANQATGANVTPVTLTGLVFSFAANSIYFFRWIGAVTPGAATTGCGFQLDVSAAVTQIAMTFFHQLASTGTLSGGHSIADDASVGVSSGLPGTGAYPVTGQGMLRTGANAGTAQLRLRSETTAVITANAGMTLVVEKVA